MKFGPDTYQDLTILLYRGARMSEKKSHGYRMMITLDHTPTSKDLSSALGNVSRNAMTLNPHFPIQGHFSKTRLLPLRRASTSPRPEPTNLAPYKRPQRTLEASPAQIRQTCGPGLVFIGLRSL